VISLCPLARAGIAVALADRRLRLNRLDRGGEVPVLLSLWLNGRLNVGVSSVSDGALGEREAGGELFLVEVDREKKLETLFVGDNGGTGSPSWEVDPRRKRFVRREEERRWILGVLRSSFFGVGTCDGGVAGVFTIIGFLVIPLETENVSIPNTPEWLSLVGVVGSGTSLDSVSSSSSNTVWHS